MVSWKDKQKVYYDKQQTKLSIDGCEQNSFMFAKNLPNIEYWMVVTCPFCLEHNQFWRFKKKQGLYKCPICTNEMMLTTLAITFDLSTNEAIENFAQWVFNYRRNGFFQKIYPKFEKWNKRLWELKISFVFWQKYNKLKGECNNEVNEYE